MTSKAASLCEHGTHLIVTTGYTENITPTRILYFISSYYATACTRQRINEYYHIEVSAIWQ